MFFVTTQEKEAAEPMLKEAEAYWINFSHYVQLGIQFLEDTKMAIPGVVEAYTRHAAMIGIIGQSDWDMIIPIYRSKDGRPGQTDIFDPDNISYIPIRVNNHIGGDKVRRNREFRSIQPLFTIRKTSLHDHHLVRSTRQILSVSDTYAPAIDPTGELSIGRTSQAAFSLDSLRPSRSYSQDLLSITRCS